MIADPPASDPPAGDEAVGERGGLLKYRRVIALVRARVADGSLQPGQPAPSGAELSRITGYSTLTCRKALRVLIADGVLVPGPSRNARPRVGGARQPQSERDLADATRALSAGLAALAGVSVTTIGHAETGRVWQSRHFWERADAALDAGGDLLRLHDAYRTASASCGQDQAPASQPVAAPAAPGPTGGTAALGTPGASGRGGPSCVTIVWDDGTVTTVRPPSR